MKKTNIQDLVRTVLLGIVGGILSLEVTTAQSLPGIPEPGLTLYGQVRNVAGGGNVRLITGDLQWTIAPSSGSPIVVSTRLKNINDQFSYIAQVPFQTVLPGFALSASTLQLNSSATDYTRSATVDGVAAAIVAPATGTFSFSAADRGRLERLDLTVIAAVTDRDSDGIPDAWETQFGLNPDDPNDGLLDLDGDGLSNADEYQAGTEPDNDASSFRFVEVMADEFGDVHVRWSSVEGRTYTIERSTELQANFEPIAGGLSATPPENAFVDDTTVGSGPFFYRLKVD